MKKARKAAHKSAKRAARYVGASEDVDDYDPHRDKRRREEEDDRAGPSTPPGNRAHKPDDDYIRAQVEEERFREKMWGALDDDERLDSVEARLNGYAHVPRRWRSGGMDRMDDDLDINPQLMEEEDYTEWVRLGMWRCAVLTFSNQIASLTGLQEEACG